MNQAETILALEAENKRLRAALANKFRPCFGNCDCPPCKHAKDSLSQPTPTTGLLDVVRAAVAWSNVDLNDTDGDDRTTAELNKAVKALPPEVMKLLEEAK